MKFVALAALLALSSPAVAAPGCVSLMEAVEVAQTQGVKPLIVRGKEMAPYVRLGTAGGAAGLATATFVAVVKVADGAYVFFGNAANVCGPLILSNEQYAALARPA